MPDHPWEQTDSGASWVHAMRRGDFALAWAISDAVLASREPADNDDPSRPYHERWIWTGTPPDGLNVLVRCYHGLGDTLQFVRFLPALRARAARVTLEVQPELAALLQGHAGTDCIVPFDAANPLPKAACTMEIMELAHVLRANVADIVGPRAYLNARAPIQGWAAKRIGLCWRAGDWDPDRSLPLSEMRARVRGEERFISLQRGPASLEASEEFFVNAQDQDVDVSRTAALIAACRSVLTVDTMVAHLAGALGASGTVLLKSEPDWRWAERDGCSLWYPTLRLADLRPDVPTFIEPSGSLVT